MEFSDDDDVQVIQILSGPSNSNNSRNNKKNGSRKRSMISYDHTESSTEEVEDSDSDFELQPSKKRKYSQSNLNFTVQKKKSSTQSKKLSQKEQARRAEAKQQKEEEKKRKKEEQERKKKEREDAKRQRENDPKVLAAKQKREEKKQKELKREKEKEQHQRFMKNFLLEKKPLVEKKPLLENGQIKNFTESKPSSLFKPFEIKKNMAVAPVHRRQLTIPEKLNLDEKLKQESPYHKKGELLSQNCISKRKWSRTVVNKDINIITSEDVKILEDTQGLGLTKHKYKLIQFHDNKKPAYWGTFKKRCSIAGPRKFWRREKDIDYEYDSDEEFEDTSEGDPIDDSSKDDDFDDPLNEMDNDILDSEDDTTYEGNHITPSTFSVPTIETRNLYKYRMLVFKPLQEDLYYDDDDDDEEIEGL